MERAICRTAGVLGAMVAGLSLWAVWSAVTVEKRAHAAAPLAACRAAVATATQTNTPNIPSGVILIWSGNNADIPAGWTRETALDDRYPKGYGAQNPNATGGSNTHTHSGSHGHTMASHQHTYNIDQASGYSSPYEDPGTYGGVSTTGTHSHASSTSTAVSGGDLSSSTVTWGSASSEPPFQNVIFIKPSGGYASIVADILGYYNGGSLPTGWSLCDGNNATPDLRNRYLKGAAVGANAGGTGGGTSHSHNLNHTHTSTAHSHTGSTGARTGGSDSFATGTCYQFADRNHIHSATLANTTNAVNSYTGTSGSGDSVEPAYKKLAVIKNVSGDASYGLIGLWLGNADSVPTNWQVCDGTNGTPDLRDRFLKVSATLGENGATGGSNTHAHGSVSHTHTSTGTHSHSGSTSGALTYRCNAGSHNSDVINASHTHGVSSISSVTATYANASIGASTVSNEPAYTTVVYIQFVNNAPSDPADPSPADAAWVSSSTPLCAWSPSTDVEGSPITYYYSLSTNQDMSSPLVDDVSTGSSPQYQNATLGDGTYYWRVRANDGTSDNLNSATWSFTVDTQNPESLILTGMRCDFTTMTINALYGTGEAGTMLNLFDISGQPISGGGTWNGSNFTFTPSTPLPTGCMVYLVSTDNASNSTNSKPKAISFQGDDDVYRDSDVCYPAPPGSSMRLQRDTSFSFKLAVNAGAEVSVTAWLRKNLAYGSGSQPQIVLSGLSISGAPATAVMTDNAEQWQQLTVRGTPGSQGIATLTVHTHSTHSGAAVWIDDIKVSQ